ncbi:hypothetical protein SORBI_3007G120401 [Sorghum bicolor]|uniref:Band 7 domain-containing protein n=2 Tax=Sorghum bicolor TaxID=4558 RepID=A0A1B6PHN3_SORBI|nr:hypothetical protein SORBI_3007G120401 [Sorghum bicolor]
MWLAARAHLAVLAGEATRGYRSGSRRRQGGPSPSRSLAEQGHPAGGGQTGAAQLPRGPAPIPLSSLANLSPVALPSLPVPDAQQFRHKYRRSRASDNPVDGAARRPDEGKPFSSQYSTSLRLDPPPEEDMGQALGLVQVDQSTVAIKESFGKFDEILEPGCHFLPWCIGKQIAGYLSLRVQQLDVRCETKTKDNVFVNVVASVQYRALADKASDAFYRLSNTREQIQSYVFDVIRASVPKMNLDDAFEQKNEIAKAVEDELEKAMSMYGYEIVQTLIVDIEPDEHVKRAMNEINAAARLRLAATEKAEAEKILQIKRAEGDAESKYLAGLGIARQRQAIVDGLRDSVLAFSENVPGTSAKDVMDMVLVTQYFDTMKEIGASSKSSSVFIPHGPGAVRDIAAQIRDGQLQASLL